MVKVNRYLGKYPTEGSIQIDATSMANAVNQMTISKGSEPLQVIKTDTGIEALITTPTIDYTVVVNNVGDIVPGTVYPKARTAELNSEIVLSAVPHSAYLFDHWEDKNGNIISDDEELTTKVTTTNNYFSAVFKLNPSPEPTPTPTPIPSTISVSLSGSEPDGGQPYGTVLTDVVVTAKYILSDPTSYPAVAAALYVNDEPVVSSLSNPLTYTIPEISTNTTVKYIARTGLDSKSATLNYIFVHPMYYGTVLSVDDIDADTIRTLDTINQVKSDVTESFTVEDGYCVFAFPAGYGHLSSIVDSIGYEYISSFNVLEVNINSLPYYVYVSDKATITAYQYTFKWSD